MKTRSAPTLRDIEAARERIAGVAQVTPIHSSETFSRRTGRSVLLKAENLQRTGSFKVRGAVNTVGSLSEA
ncbi:MAG: pyridoxal-phosphate dependent enzyme, partial [Gaiellaceae bacterium]